MKKSLFFALMTGCISFGQNCKYERNEVDEFTNKTILETKEEALAMSRMGLGFSSTYSLLKIDDHRIFKLNIYSPSIFTLREGEDILFKTDGETPITLKFPKTIIAESGYNSFINTTHWKGNMLISISD